ncbi:ribose-5-phosphate isomerase RpiA [Oceanobacillus sp. AG]|uniref:ribose-5-phosphate isomerase RpiA n=1 Tax=Oceanobacillus sp. AG TaxID=2681969 RepID=UPI0012EB4283|nr:ribose-5-phosphate isomerase RpiA [Oceanobacillus sp. AG]
MNRINQSKQLVGQEAVKYIQDGMKVGLGSGSTVYYMVKALGERVKAEGLNVVAISTSEVTGEWAKEFGIPLTDFSYTQELDVAIDGADEVDDNLQLIKGGGGALFREKVVAAAAKEFIVIVDESKIVSTLGKFPLPVEIVPFGWEAVARKIEKLGGAPKLREKAGEIFVTDNGNYILDCAFEEIHDPVATHEQLIALVGVVETGLFVDMTKKVIVADNGSTKLITK